MKAKIIEYEKYYQVFVFEQKTEYQLQIFKNGKTGICKSPQGVFSASEFEMLFPDVFAYAQKVVLQHKKA